MYLTYLTNLLLVFLGVIYPVILLLIVRMVFRTAPTWVWVSLLVVAFAEVVGSLPFMMSQTFFEHSPFHIPPNTLQQYRFPLTLLSSMGKLGLLAVVYAMALHMRKARRT